MMRSLFSAVSGLKTHQTRMDVIGNNIANVNTEAFKASSVRFSELMYQTMSTASGGDASTGTGGVNAKQVGLGVSTASTMINITGAGSSETTGNPFDLKLSDSQTTNFFIVSDGTNTMFTRAGSFYVDGNGYLCMSSTGYTVQGWQVDKTTGEIHKDTVSPLQVMSPSNTTSAPEATTEAYVHGILDKEDTDVTGKDDGAGFSVFRNGQLHAGRAQQVACVDALHLHALTQVHRLAVFAGGDVLLHIFRVLNGIQRLHLGGAGTGRLAVLPLSVGLLNVGGIQQHDVSWVVRIRPWNPCFTSMGTRPVWSIWAWVMSTKSMLPGWKGRASLFTSSRPCCKPQSIRMFLPLTSRQ